MLSKAPAGHRICRCDDTTRRRAADALRAPARRRSVTLPIVDVV
jgi:hypothetical protein